ncbi:insulin gene enhancer protein ISL-1-like isoform X2 [Scyliorhinus canicula]|uniref:insulin gene enhancer protein ISL-1-like isoform X2 n=1 Tax=Scyliorhinus canicula TaxID=7830 RepID=UPI0018F6E61A|nr:insulin gene enhancer protein ISL-1-like isoform X2 [Scyliorhinus canicula]
MGDLGNPSKREDSTSVCFGCSEEITDHYILRVHPDLEWHATCLKCVKCNQYLDESRTCFLREGKTYCKTDYFKHFSVRCAQCEAGLLSSDMVLRVRGLIYHQRCFRCVACNRQLLPGDKCRLRFDGPYCIEDGWLLDSSSIQEDTLRSVSDVYISERVKTCQPALRAPNHPDKITRVRTVLNEQQLLTLRTCYAANPRPDALMKQQLIEMTGLSSRVIRVWFQNKRCKEKKKSILQKHTDQCGKNKADIQGLVGTLMIATSPLQQKLDIHCSPVEVQRYRPPWEDLGDFTLQTGFPGGRSHSICSSSEVSSLSSQLADMQNCEESQGPDL